MYLPNLSRDRNKFIIVQKYNTRGIAAAIFLFLTKDISYRDIETSILNVDSKGYLFLDILKYYGLRREHCNIFNDSSYEYVKNAVRDKVLEDNEYETLFTLLNSVTIETIEKNYPHLNMIKTESEPEHLDYKVENTEINNLSEVEKEAYFNVISKIRNKTIQDKFRKDLLDEFNCKCALCEVDIKCLLIASHIIPYSMCEGMIDKAGDSNNGLLLCPIHDALFESGKFISFNQKGEIIISSKISKSDYDKYKIHKSIILNLKHMTKKRKQYLIEHNKMFVEKNEKS